VNDGVPAKAMARITMSTSAVAIQRTRIRRHAPF
jgi:hypothetical protein